MKKKMNRTIVLLLLIAIMLSLCSCGGGATNAKNLDDLQADTAEYLCKEISEPTMNSVGGEWTVMALKKSNYNVKQSYYDRYFDRICQEVKKAKGKITDNKYTDYARVSLALYAIGKDPTNIKGYNLMKPLEDFDSVVRQGINGPIFALIAANAGGYKLKVEDKYLQYILGKELSEGGFAFDRSIGASDIDITAMALQALSFYQDNGKVKNAIDRAVEKLAALQENSGGYKDAESNAQAIIALTALGIDPLSDKRFIKEGNTLGDVLMEYRMKNHGFAHQIGKETNLMATEQSLCALDALAMYKEGKLFYGN